MAALRLYSVGKAGLLLLLCYTRCSDVIINKGHALLFVIVNDN